MARHTSTAPASPSRITRRVLSIAAVFTTTAVIALVGTGTSYALWSGRADVNASTVTSGTTGLTVDGSTALVLTGLDSSRLGPGQSVVAPVTVKNNGTTRLAVTVANTVASGTRSMADELTLTITPVWSASGCRAGLTGGVSGRVNGFSTASAPVTLGAQQTMAVCLQLTLDEDAPTSTQNATSSFVLTLDGKQVR